MRRRECLLLAAGLSACRRPAATEPLLPETVAEVWQRKDLKELPAATAPEPLTRNAVRRVVKAIYEGPGKLSVDVYELTSSAGGLDAAQRWRPAADTVFFYQNNYFAVVKWEKADRKALTAFVRALEKRLGALGAG